MVEVVKDCQDAECVPRNDTYEHSDEWPIREKELIVPGLLWKRLRVWFTKSMLVKVGIQIPTCKLEILS